MNVIFKSCYCFKIIIIYGSCWLFNNCFCQNIILTGYKIHLSGVTRGTRGQYCPPISFLIFWKHHQMRKWGNRISTVNDCSFCPFGVPRSITLYSFSIYLIRVQTYRPDPITWKRILVIIFELDYLWYILLILTVILWFIYFCRLTKNSGCTIFKTPTSHFCTLVS